MDPVTFAYASLVAVIIIQAADLLGHLINGLKLRRAQKRLDDAEVRGKAILEALSVLLGAAGVQVVDGRYVLPAHAGGWNGGDPSAARSRREELADQEALAESGIMAALTAKLGEPTKALAFVEFLKSASPKTWKRMTRNPALAEGILTNWLPVMQARVARGAATTEAATAAPEWR